MRLCAHVSCVHARLDVLLQNRRALCFVLFFYLYMCLMSVLSTLCPSFMYRQVGVEYSAAEAAAAAGEEEEEEAVADDHVALPSVLGSSADV